MGFSGIGHWVILAIVVLVLFGRGRISEMMGDFGKGISSFKKGLAEGEEVKPQPPAGQIPPPASVEPKLNGEPIADPSANKPQ
ncbi:MAG: twin-arginine translocase TatA/TatE family subunit [Sphingomonadales bacterium]|nr:twin-arginine translocase TatA/TatE family subunit [Sphingomonadales bacterium]